VRDWFASLQARERLFVIAAAGVLVFAIFWVSVWMPLDRGQEELAASVDQWRESLAELRLLKGRMGDGDARASAPADVNRSLVLIVDSTLREHGLYSALQRSQPGTNNDIRIELRDAAFDDLVLWLGDVSSRYGLQVQAASFLAASEQNNGRVNSTVTLER
jgi:general secretion pathway protein M